MRTRITLILALAGVLMVACADRGPIGGEGTTASTGPPLHERRIGIYEAAIRSQIEFKGAHVWILDRICTDADAADRPTGDCPDRFSPAEQDELALRLADMGDVRFVDETGSFAQRLVEGDAHGQVVRLGPIDERDGRIEVAASHVCGGLCGGGSVWVVEPTEEGWEVTGPAPGEGVWIS